jgi:hypothetical protein
VAIQGVVSATLPTLTANLAATGSTTALVDATLPSMAVALTGTVSGGEGLFRRSIGGRAGSRGVN